MDLSQSIEECARRTPAKTALHFQGERIDYAALATRVRRIAAALAAHGVGRGACVAWLGLNSPDMLATLFACARIGAVFMPLNWRLVAAEHRAMLQSCPPALLMVDEPFVQASAAQRLSSAPAASIALGATVPRDWTGWDAFLAAGADGEARAAAPGANPPGTPLLLCYTSGSTGRPKGALLSHEALACNAANSVDMHAMTADDRVLTTLPLFHVGGLNIQTLPALHAGCTVTLHPKFDADATFDAIEGERITLTVLVPAQLDAMRDHPRWASADL